MEPSSAAASHVELIRRRASEWIGQVRRAEGVRVTAHYGCELCRASVIDLVNINMI